MLPEQLVDQKSVLRHLVGCWGCFVFAVALSRVPPDADEAEREPGYGLQKRRTPALLVDAAGRTRL